MRRIFSAASTVETGITPYPACAKTAFRMGANTLSAEIERTDGRIVLSRRLTLAFSVLVYTSIALHLGLKQVKKGLIFMKTVQACRFENRTPWATVILIPLTDCCAFAFQRIITIVGRNEQKLSIP
jgi:hypothetical protein